jgi:hypothetical protein
MLGEQIMKNPAPAIRPRSVPQMVHGLKIAGGGRPVWVSIRQPQEAAGKDIAA